MTLNKYLVASAAVLLLTSCYRDIDLDNGKKNEGKDLLTLNSMVCADSAIKVAATRTFFFNDKNTHEAKDFVKGLEIELSVNGEPRGTMQFDDASSLYVSPVTVYTGDVVEISTTYHGQSVTACDSVPAPVTIESVTVKRDGPMSIYTDNDYLYTYYITFTDRASAADYYFLQWDITDRRHDEPMGERVFSKEYVFNALANDVHATLPGWKPYSYSGLPFSDKGIDGQRHTIMVQEIVQDIRHHYSQMNCRIMLYTISKSYYDYLFSILLNKNDGSGIKGGLIDLGIADPVKVFSNINGGVGMLGCYTVSTAVIDVYKAIGQTPK